MVTSEPITIGIKTMELSDNRKEHWVFVRRGDREITPHNYSGPYLNRAEYEVAEWKHVLLGWPKPDLMDPKYNDPEWTVEHDWQGLIHIKDEYGQIVLTLAKHASGTPGSGIPVNTHAKSQHERALRIAKAKDINTP